MKININHSRGYLIHVGNPASPLQETGSSEERLPAEESGHRFVHDAVALDEAQRGLGQRRRVGGAPARARRRLLDLGHRQPVGVGRLLKKRQAPLSSFARPRAWC